MGKEDLEVLAARIAEGEKREREEKIKEFREKMKKERKGFFTEFKKFITRGNVMDLAVGVIIGGAFSAIVTALTNHILMPIINFILLKITRGNGLDEIYTYLKWVGKLDEDGNKVLTEAGEWAVDLAKSIYIDWGAFITAIINFILIALVLFLIVRTFNRVKEAGNAVYCGYTKEEYKAFRKAGKMQDDIVAMAAERDAKAAEEKKAADEAAAAAEAAKIERENKFYENVARQTELLEQLTKK